MKSIIKICFILVSSIALIACGGGNGGGKNSAHNDPVPQTRNIAEILSGTVDLSTLNTAVTSAGLDSVLADESATFTVFAPSNGAFNKLGDETINALLADIDTLSDILLYHVIPGSKIGSSDAVSAAGSKLETANGDMLAVSVVDGEVYINNSKVIVVDIEASNGVVHFIDTVITPPADMGMPTDSIVDIAISNPDFSTLVTALQAANLVDVLADETSTFTVFAPTNDAFAKIPSDTLDAVLADIDTLTAILLQHVVAGAAVDSVTAYTLNGQSAETASGAMVDISVMDGKLYVAGSEVIVKDIYATNGIIHVIDTVIVE